MTSYKDHHNKILRMYDNQRLQNQRDLDKRRKEIYEKIPMIKELDEQLVTYGANSSRLSLMGDIKALDDFLLKSQDLKEQQEELLFINDFPKNYLNLWYKCDKCEDTGYYNNQKCNCLKQALADLIYTDSNLMDILSRENFNNFRFDLYSDSFIDETTNTTPRNNIQKIVASSKIFVRNFDKSKENLLLMGNTGVGKTFLANCIAKELLDLGYIVIYLTAFRLFDILEKYKFNKNNDNQYNTSNQFEYILECDLLIIDDLGTELSNSFTNSQLYLIINERLLRQKSTIISTNLSIDLLIKNYSERIYSRIISNYSIRRIIGEDIRLYKALNDSNFL